MHFFKWVKSRKKDLEERPEKRSKSKKKVGSNLAPPERDYSRSNQSPYRSGHTSNPQDDPPPSLPPRNVHSKVSHRTTESGSSRDNKNPSAGATLKVHPVPNHVSVDGRSYYDPHFQPGDDLSDDRWWEEPAEPPRSRSQTRERQPAPPESSSKRRSPSSNSRHRSHANSSSHPAYSKPSGSLPSSTGSESAQSKAAADASSSNSSRTHNPRGRTDSGHRRRQLPRDRHGIEDETSPERIKMEVEKWKTSQSESGREIDPSLKKKKVQHRKRTDSEVTPSHIAQPEQANFVAADGKEYSEVEFDELVEKRNNSRHSQGDNQKYPESLVDELVKRHGKGGHGKGDAPEHKPFDPSRRKPVSRSGRVDNSDGESKHSSRREGSRPPSSRDRTYQKLPATRSS